MDVGAARRRFLGAISAPFEFTDEDDAAAEEPNAVCALGQVLSGAVFGFLFGIVGFVMAGEATRSLWWLVFMSAGVTLGTYAARSIGVPGEECELIYVCLCTTFPRQYSESQSSFHTCSTRNSHALPIEGVRGRVHQRSVSSFHRAAVVI